MQVATIGVDFTKYVFQLHGVGPDGTVILRQRLRRAQVVRLFAKLALSGRHGGMRDRKSLGA